MPAKPVDCGRVVAALVQIESGGRDNAIGDNGRALGPLQFHPEAFYDWLPRPYAGETWQNWFRRTALAFVEAWTRTFPDGAADECAVVYHRHCRLTRATQQDYSADDYARRFREAYDQLGGV